MDLGWGTVDLPDSSKIKAKEFAAIRNCKLIVLRIQDLAKAYGLDFRVS